MNLQYFERSPLILDLEAYSAESSSSQRVITVPLSAFSQGSSSYSGLPSQLHLTASDPSFHDNVSMVTFLDTIKAE